jgi:acyl-coenzyme A synthetase/AMP-(fatty) acid ligase
MVKRRGYRVELGEIEAAFHRLDGVREAAAVAAPDEEAGVRISLFYAWRPDAGAPPSSLKLRQHAARHLPPYMIPDVFRQVDALPMTSTDKIDYQTLLQLARSS